MWCWKKEINFEADFELNNFGFNVDEAHRAFGKEVEWAVLSLPILLFPLLIHTRTICSSSQNVDIKQQVLF